MSEPLERRSLTLSVSPTFSVEEYGRASDLIRSALAAFLSVASHEDNDVEVHLFGLIWLARQAIQKCDLVDEIHDLQIAEMPGRSVLPDWCVLLPHEQREIGRMIHETARKAGAR